MNAHRLRSCSEGQEILTPKKYNAKPLSVISGVTEADSEAATDAIEPSDSPVLFATDVTDKLVSGNYMPEDTTFLQDYEIIKVLFSLPLSPTKVSLAKDPSGELVVIKAVEKKNLVSSLMRENVKQECALHDQLNHPNIVSLKSYTETEESFDLVLEHVNKASMLADIVVKNHTCIEDEHLLKTIARDTLKGMMYLHYNHVIHADLKVDNILAQEDASGNLVFKICDFGISIQADSDTKTAVSKETVGSLGYIAPEMRKGAEVTSAIDIFSFGVTLYEMSVGYKPTTMDKGFPESGALKFFARDWKDLQPELQDLITRMLNKDPSQRITAEDALEHPWLKSE